jgi:hypothetical protein
VHEGWPGHYYAVDRLDPGGSSTNCASTRFLTPAKTQQEIRIWIFVSIYALVAIARKRLEFNDTLCQNVQISSLNLLEKTIIL